MRKMLIPLALAVVTMVSSVGCTKVKTRCRNLFRRGAPCCGTTRVTPAMIGAPMAIGAPVATATPTPILQQMMPQAAPQMMVPQMVAPQIQCCPPMMQACPPCDPCQIPCDPCCPQGCVETGMISGGCQNCGTETTHNQGYIVPGSEVVGEPLVDPGPTGSN